MKLFIHNVISGLKPISDPQRSWLVTAIIPVIATIIIPLYIFYKPNFTKDPKFIIVNSILKSNSTIVIKANNKIANKHQKLDVIFDGYTFPKAAIPENTSSDSMQQWHFSLKQQRTIKSIVKSGKHFIQVSFPGKKWSSRFEIFFLNDQPIVDAELITIGNNSKILKGKATTKSQIPGNEINVEIIFYHEGPTEKRISVPVRKVEYINSGLVYFEFETNINNFPKIPPEDPRYNDIFFSLKISDKAYNTYFYEESYSQFISSGKKKFGAFNTDFKLNNIYEETIKSPNNFCNVKKSIQVHSDTQIVSLKVTRKTVNLKEIRRLDWETTNINKHNTLSLIYRDDKQVGRSKSNSYTDTEEIGKDFSKYFVTVIDEKGKKFISNTEYFEKKNDDDNLKFLNTFTQNEYFLLDFLFKIIGIASIFIFYYLSIQQKINDNYSWNNVLFWATSIVGWSFIMLMVAYGKIEEGGRTSQLFFCSSGLLMFITILFLTKQTRNWEKIVSGVLIALIAFGILAAFVTGQNSKGYALVMGLLGGGFVGQFISTTKGVYGKLCKTRNLYISHAWKQHDTRYWKLAGWFHEEPNFSCINYSCPDKTKKGLKKCLTKQISSSHGVIILAGMYAAHKEWIDYEIDEALRMGKIIIGVRSFGQERIPVKVQNAANRIVDWNRSSIIHSVRDLI